MNPLRLAILVLLAGMTGAAELSVGPGKRFVKPSQAAASAHDGDTVSIDAGVYEGDVCVWKASNLTLRGVGGLAHMKSGGKVAIGKAIWVLQGDNTTVDGIEFSGAASPDNNGAGIRLDGTGMAVRNSYFHGNQNGILVGVNPACDILVERCEFAANGRGDGQTHNLYIGRIRTLTMRWSYSHHAKVGHNLKTRAANNIIIGNRFMDEATGNSSYLVDVPNGGLTFLIGNLIEQGPATSNHGVMVNYGEEGAANPLQRLYVINNTLVNDCAKGGVFVHIAPTTTLARVENNIFLGEGAPFSGPVTSKLRNLSTTTGVLLDRAAYDYHLLGGSAAVDAGVDPGSADGQVLLPTSQYVHPKGMEGRIVMGSAPDIGAYEFGVSAAALARRKKGGEAAGEAVVNKPLVAKAVPQLVDGKQKEQWITRLRSAAEGEIAAKREPQFELSSLRAQATLRELRADGTMVVALSGTGEMTVTWGNLNDRDRANLAAGMARRNDPQLNALAACFMFLSGDEPPAREYLMKAGEQGAAVEAAFGLAVK